MNVYAEGLNRRALWKWGIYNIQKKTPPPTSRHYKAPHRHNKNKPKIPQKNHEIPTLRENASVILTNSNHTAQIIIKKMAEATTRYGRRISSISRQLRKTLRRIYQNRWARYAAITIRPSTDASGHIAAVEMYNDMLKANPNGAT